MFWLGCSTWTSTAEGQLLVLCQFWPYFHGPVLDVFLAVSGTVGGTETVRLLGREPEYKYISWGTSIGLGSLRFLQVMHVHHVSVRTFFCVFGLPLLNHL